MPRPIRQSRRRKPADPILMGEPSPALTKIGRMNTEKLQAHVETMKLEAGRLEVKIANLSKIEPPDAEKIAQLKVHQERLAAIMAFAQERLDGKLERKQQRDDGTFQGSRGYRR